MSRRKSSGSHPRKQKKRSKLAWGDFQTAGDAQYGINHIKGPTFKSGINHRRKK